MKKNKLKAIISTIWNGIGRNLSIIVAVATLIVAVAALRVADSSLYSANQSLAIAEQSLVLSSKDFTPIFEFDIDDNMGKVSIKNQMHSLYKIEGLSIYEIIERGFDLKNNDSLVSFALLTKSAHYEDYQWVINNDSGLIEVDLTQSTQRASRQKCYDENFVHRIDSYLSTYYDIDSPRGYALPSLHSIRYLIDVFYRDRSGQVRSVYLFQEHVHGRGWWKQVIKKEQFQSLLQQAEHKPIESMTDIDSIMDYFITTCKVALK